MSTGNLKRLQMEAGPAQKITVIKDNKERLIVNIAR